MTLLQRFFGAIVGVLLFVAAFVFASFVLALAAALAIVIWGWLWWRTRQLRQAAKRGEATVIEVELRRRGGARDAGTVIEGEYRVEDDRRRSGGARE